MPHIHPTKALRLVALHIAEEYGVRSASDLQRWIDDMHADKKAASTIKTYVANWCREHGVRATDINIKYPRQLVEIKYVPTKDDLNAIIRSKPHWADHFRFLVSSGLRVGELAALTPADITRYKDRYRIHVPARITKTGKARITFSRYDLPAPATENKLGKRFAAMRQLSKLDKMASVGIQNRYAIHVHSLRRYFITTINKIQFGVGHVLAGHDYYMSEYNVYTEAELYKYHKRADPGLTLGAT